ncbi:MAG: VOC family protein [Chloroflexi bacterium]|nr:VOC family protein [Chloroflexota bacterium]
MPKYFFDHVHLYSPDPAKTAEAYEKMFGVKARQFDLGGGRIITSIKLGDTVILISKPRDESEMGLMHFGVRTDNLEQAAVDLKAQGVKFTQEPRSINPKFKVSFLKAPEDVTIELTEGTL